MSVLERALQFVTQAVEEDTAQNYEPAYRLYASAIAEMELACHSLSIPAETWSAAVAPCEQRWAQRKRKKEKRCDTHTASHTT